MQQTCALFSFFGALLFALAIHSSNAAEQPVDAAARDAVIAHYDSGAEPMVEAAAWTAKNTFNVGVHYMGGNEDGMADDVCKVLKSRGVTSNVRVQVIDINTMGEDQKRWEVVGLALCR